MPCWTISYFSSSFGLRTPASDPRGTRDIDSTPPAITTSAWPVMTSIEAKLNACRPEAHIRFTLVPGTDSGNPDERCEPSDVHPLLVDLRDASEDDVLDDLRLDAGAVGESPQRERGE